MAWTAALTAACAAVTFAVFLRARGNDFLMTWDDGHFIVGNEVIRRVDLAMVKDLLSATTVHYWAPLSWLSLALDYQVWGLDPGGFHLTNVLLHAVNAGLVFLLALRLLELPAVGLSGRTARWAAALAALLWSLHPLRVEAVAWAVERKSVLGLLFALGALHAWLGHARSGLPFWRSPRYWLCFALYGLSLAAKPVLVTLPLVLAVLDAYPLRRPGRGLAPRELAEKVPLLGLAAVVTAVFILSSHHHLTIPLEEAGLASRLLTSLRSIWDYTSLVAWPSGLSPFYLHQGRVALGDLSFLVPAALVVAATAALLLQARRVPAAAAAWLAWLIALAPAIASTQVALTSMADRLTYFAALPLSLLAAGGLAKGLQRLGRRQVSAAAAVAVLVVLALLGDLTMRQLGFWRDDETLWSRPIDLHPRLSGFVYTQRSMAREQHGDLEGARVDMDQAIAIAASKRYRAIDPLYARRAQLHAQGGAFALAAADYGRALQTEDRTSRVGYLRARAAVYRAAGRIELAAADEQLAGQLAGQLAASPAGR